MTAIPDAGRQSAHVILDAVTAWDPSLGIADENNDAMNLALDRLNEIDGAIEVDVDDDEDELDVTLDVTNLAGGTIVLVNYLRELPFLCDELLPRLERKGLRQKTAAKVAAPAA